MTPDEEETAVLIANPAANSCAVEFQIVAIGEDTRCCQGTAVQGDGCSRGGWLDLQRICRTGNAAGGLPGVETRDLYARAGTPTDVEREFGRRIPVAPGILDVHPKGQMGSSQTTYTGGNRLPAASVISRRTSL